MGNCSVRSGTYGASDKESNPSNLLIGNDLNCIVHDGPILGMSYSADQHLITCGDDRRIAILNLNSMLKNKNYVPHYLDGHSKAVNRVFRSSSGSHIWSCSRDLSIRMWNFSSGICEKVISDAHELNITALTQSPFDTGTIISGSRDYSVKCWDFESDKCKTKYSLPRNIVTAIETSPIQPGIIYQGAEDLHVRVWDTRISSNNGPTQTINGYVYFPVCICIHENGHLLATGCKGFDSVGCTVKLWDLRNISQPIHEYIGHNQDVIGCKFTSKDSDLLVTTSKDGSLRVWDTTADNNTTTNITGTTTGTTTNNTNNTNTNANYAYISHIGKLNTCLTVPDIIWKDSTLVKADIQTECNEQKSDSNNIPELNNKNTIAVGANDGSITLANLSSKSKIEEKPNLKVFCTTKSCTSGIEDT